MFCIKSIAKLLTPNSLDLKSENNSLETINILPIYIQNILGYRRQKALDVKRTDFFHVLNLVNWELVCNLAIF